MTSDQLRRLRAGDVTAFEQLFKELHAPLCEVVDSYVGSQTVAEELVQDLFFTVWLRRAQLEVASLRGYLFTAARNRALHHLRRQSLAKQFRELAAHLPELNVMSSAPRGADVELQREEQRAAVRTAIDALPPRSRLALVLHLDHDMTQVEVAEAMGISLKGVEKLLASARGKLRILLAEQHR